MEMESAPKFDVIVVNDDLENAKRELFERVKAFVDQA